MYISFRFWILSFVLCIGCAADGKAQAAWLALRLPLAQDTMLAGNRMDGVLRTRYFSAVGLSSGSLGWAWYAAGAAGLDTSRSWRPLYAKRTISGLNQLIFPDTTHAAASALYMDSLGESGLLPSIKSNTWLSWHISTFSTSTRPEDEWMVVCSTAYQPAKILTWSAPDTISAGSNARISVKFDRNPAPGEWAGIEFDTLATLKTAQRLRLEVTDSLAEGFLPCYRVGQRIWFRIFTSCIGAGIIDSLFKAHGPLASRMLSLDETGACCDSLFVRAATGLQGDYLIPGACFSSLEDFVDTLNRVGHAGSVTCHVRTGYREKLSSGTGLQLVVPGDSMGPLCFMPYGKGPKPLLIAAPGNRSMNSSSARIDGIWAIHGTDYLSIEGFELVDSNAATSGSARMEYGFALFKDSLNGGCHAVRIADCTIRFMALMSSAGPTAFEDGNKGIALVNARATALNRTYIVAGSKELHSDVLLEGDTIQNAYTGMLIKGMSDNISPYRRLDSAVTVLNCAVWDFGEEGIKMMNVRGARVENNHIHTHPHSTQPFSAPVSERFGIVFTSGHLYSEAGIRIAHNTITLGGRALSGSQNLFGIALRQNGGNGNRIEVLNNHIHDCINRMSNSTFYGIRNTGQRHSLRIESNTLNCNKGSATGNHAVAISNTAQIHQALLIRGNRISRDTFSGEYTGISHQGQARILETVCNEIDSVAVRGRFTALQLHSNGLDIRADSNSVECIRAGGAATAISLRSLATSSTTSCSLKGNAIQHITADSTGSLFGIELNNGSRHKAELHANRIARLYGMGRISAIVMRSREVLAANNRIAVLDGLPGGRAQISGIELFPGLAVLQHNTLYLRGNRSDSSFAPAALRWSDSLGSKLLLQNNVLLADGSGGWNKPVSFIKIRSGLDTNRIGATSSGNYLYADGQRGHWLYYNATDNTGDSLLCDLNKRLIATGLPNLAYGGSGKIELDESFLKGSFLLRENGNHWPRNVQAAIATDALGRTRSMSNMQVPGALVDTFFHALETHFICTGMQDTTPLYAPSGHTELARWTLEQTARVQPEPLMKVAFSLDSTLAADSLRLWARIGSSSAFRRFGKMLSASGAPVFADSLNLMCNDTVCLKLSAVLNCNPGRKDSFRLKIAYLIQGSDSLAGSSKDRIIRNTPRNRPALGIAGSDTLCPAVTGTWSRRGGILEPGARWFWYDDANDSLLGSGDTIRLQFKSARRLMLIGAGKCDTTTAVTKPVEVYTLPGSPENIRADRDTLCRGVANWFYPRGGKKGSGGVWSWYAGVAADTFLQSGDALRFSLQKNDTLFLRAEALCANSDWVKLPLAVRDAAHFDWIGSHSETWHQKANWCDTVPGKHDTVRIGNKQAVMPRLSAAAAVGTLLLDSGAYLTLDSGVRLSVYGNLTAGARQLSGHRAAIVCMANDTVKWQLNGQLGVDTLIMAGVGMKLRGGTVLRHLVLESGLLVSNPDTLTLEAQAVAGKTNDNFLASWIHGPIVQQFGNDSLINIPTGDGKHATPVGIRLHRQGSLSGLRVHYQDKPGNDSGLTASEFGIGFNFIAGPGIWFLHPLPDTTHALFDLKLWFDGHPDYVHNLQDGAFTILRRHDTSRLASDWELPKGSSWPGRDSMGTRVRDGFALRKGINGFSQFGIAGAAAPLPTGFLDFRLTSTSGGEALLRWQIEPAVEITHFRIEQWVAGKWHAIGNVQANVESGRDAYSYRSSALNPGRHVFRVAACNNERTYFFSPALFCDIAEPPMLRVYPNPFGDWLEMRVSSDLVSKPVQLILTDLQGRSVYRFIGLLGALHRIRTHYLVSGWYTLELLPIGHERVIRVPVFKN